MVSRRAFPRQLLDHRGRELEGQHRGVGHDADAHVEQYGGVVPHHDGMPEAPGQADFVEIADADRKIAEKRNENRSAQDRAIALHAQQVNCGADAEACGRQSDAAKRSQPYPEAPRHLVAQVGAGAEAFEEADIRCVHPGDEDDRQNRAPHRHLRLDSRKHG